MPLINVPGVGTVNFPSTMSNEQIVEAIERDILPGRAGATQQAPTESRMGLARKEADRGAEGRVEGEQESELAQPPSTGWAHAVHRREV